MTNIDAKRHDRTALEAALREAGATIKGNVVKCPFHDDKHPSGSVYADSEGIWRYKCNAGSCGFGGDIFDVLAKATGRDVKDVLRDERPAGTSSRSSRRERVFGSIQEVRQALAGVGDIQREHRYENKYVGRPDLVVFRMQTAHGKTFRQCSPVPYKAGQWQLKSPKKPWPLYRRDEIKDADEVIVVEGEKCVEALVAVGIKAVTTAPCGAGKAQHCDWRILAGKRVYLWPDADDAGRAHMKGVRAELEKLDPAPDVRIIDPADNDLLEGEDVVDLIEQCRVTDLDVVTVIDRGCALAKSFNVSSGLRDRIEATIDGTWSDVPWPWAKLTQLSRALLPQTVTVLCGTPGAAKSFWLFKSLVTWQAAGVPWACLALEEDRTYHLARVMALREHKVELIDPEYQRDNPEEIRAAYERQRPFLDTFGRRLWDAPIEAMTLEAVTDWVRCRARDGARVIAVDPVTAAVATAKPWVADSKFITNVKAIVRSYDCSLILVTHPKKGSKMIGLDDLAGGSSYQRLAQTVLWLERTQTPEQAVVMGPLGRYDTEVRHRLHLCKTRNGRGHGLSLGFEVDWPRLGFRELGVLIDE